MKAEQFIELISKKIDEGVSFPARTKEGACIYGEDCSEKRCFIGILIPKGHPVEELFATVTDILQRYPDLREYMPTDITNAGLSRIQSIHDSYGKNSTAEDFKTEKDIIISKLKEIAAVHKK